jgi:protein-disulfide isomerase
MTMSRTRLQCDGAFSFGKFAPAWVVAILCVCVLVRTTEVFAKGNALAEVDGDAITADEIEKSIGAPLSKLEEQIYALKRRALDALIARRLVGKAAERRGMSPQALLEAETRDVDAVTEQEIEAAWRQQKGQLNSDEMTAKEQIRRQLYTQKIAARERAFIDRLRAQSVVVVNLKPPAVFRVASSTEGAPFKGPAAAPVTIVEFQDFHCPFCRRVQPTLAQLSARYGDHVRLVYRDFPIDSLHPQARNAHEAARCADAQGRFWAYHDALYSKPPKAGLDDLKAIAKDVDLDMGAFDACLTAGTYRAAVQKDIDEGTRLGVTGTPTFFINGRVIAGAQPLETFTRIADEELARPN